MYPSLKHVALWALTCLISLLLTEAMLRLAALASPAVHGALYPHRVPDPRLGWRFDPDFPDIDARGFRNGSVPVDADVVVLGDSQTYGYGVPAEKSWPRLLEEQTGDTTYAMACSEYGPAHSYLLFDEAVDMRPEHLIEALYTGNDLYDAFELVYDQGQLAELRTTDAALAQRLADLERADPLSKRGASVTRMGAPTWPGRDLLRAHSRLYCMALYLSRSTDALALSIGAPEEWADVRQSALAHPDYLDVFDDGRSRTVFTCRKRQLALDLSDPRLQEGLRLTLACLDSLQARAQRLGIGFTVALIPTKEQVFAERIGARGGPGCTVLAELLQNEAAVWSAVRAHLASHNTPCIETLPALRACLDRGDSPYRMTADGHPNETGYAAIAGAVAAHLRRGSGLAPRSPEPVSLSSSVFLDHP